LTETVQPGARRGGGVSLALVLACAAVLLAPEADPEALRAQGVARLLRQDADRAGVGEVSLVRALAEVGGFGELVVRVNGQADAGPIAEAVRAALRDRGEGAADAQLPQAADSPRVEIDVRVDGARLAVTGAVRGAGRTRTLPVPAPVFLSGRAALLPPLLAIGAALVWRRTLPALFLGILAGSIAMAARAGAGLWAPLRGAVDVFGVYLAREITDTFRLEIIGFIVALLGMVGVMSRAGGMAGLVERSRALARGARSAQLVTWVSGLLVFFDDYANCMLVGTTLRPVTDRLRVSREKLAFIVDSTAAPVAGLSLLSTWIAFQVSIFAPQLPSIGIDEPAYAVFVASLPYRFYCWLALFFVFAVAATGRDFGPMRRAEERARRSGEVARPGSRPPISDGLVRMQPAEGMPSLARRAVVPVAVTLLATLLGIFFDGGGPALLAGSDAAWRDPARWREVLLEGSGAGPIFLGAIAGLATAAFGAGSNRLRVALAAGAVGGVVTGWAGGPWGLAAIGAAAMGAGLGERVAGGTRRPHLAAREVARASAACAPTLGFASVLLFEAWMIGAVCADLGTADYLVALLADALHPMLLPVLLFVVAGLVAFATGSSWSTMAILLPNAVPLAAALGVQSDLGAPLMVALVIGAVLDGAIFGDHCSPISDTTVLSSVASGCDHLDHVRTQAPYAVSVALVALVAGHLPLLLGLPWGPGAGLLAGAVAILAILVGIGRRIAPPTDATACPDPELP
jgi:Na+/H+ antiporter NhaC